MTTLSTHDTKRGEDVRARIAVLAELPYVWDVRAGPAARAGARCRIPASAHLLWQAVVGAWPASRERLHGYAEKAMREAGDRTTWTAPDLAYEDAVHAAVDAAFDDPAVRDGAGRPARAGHRPRLVERPGRQAGVDHHARRPRRLPGQRALGAEPGRPRQPPVRSTSTCAPSCSAELGDCVRRTAHGRRDDPGHRKLLVTHRALRLRRDRPELFTTYAGLTATGAGCRPRARVRPRRRGHRRHPAAGRPRPRGRLGGHPARAARRHLARRAVRSHLRVRRAALTSRRCWSSYHVALLVREDE